MPLVPRSDTVHIRQIEVFEGVMWTKVNDVRSAAEAGISSLSEEVENVL